MGITYSRPLGAGTPTTGETVFAAQLNDPIDQIYDTILALGITDSQLASSSVTTPKLATAAVTAAKMDGTLPDASALATSAAPTLDKQVANKKYVDDTANDTVNAHVFGAWTSIGSTGTAASDGFLVCESTQGGGMEIETPTGTRRAITSAVSGKVNSATVPIRSGDTWTITNADKRAFLGAN